MSRPFIENGTGKYSRAPRHSYVVTYVGGFVVVRGDYPGKGGCDCVHASSRHSEGQAITNMSRDSAERAMISNTALVLEAPIPLSSSPP